MRPQSAHSNFFFSLKQVEKRLKLEQPPDSESSNNIRAEPEINCTPAESLSTPIYLNLDQPIYLNLDQPTNTTNTLQGSSEPPQAFLSSSPQFPQTLHNPPQEDSSDPVTTAVDVDDIENLIELLSLSDFQLEPQPKEKQGVGVCGGGSCGCEGGFYEKIVGVKGPKCEKEVEIMDGWIKHFRENGREPLRLAFLLLGKAVFESGSDSDFRGLEFPSAVDEFLRNNPPKD